MKCAARAGGAGGNAAGRVRRNFQFKEVKTCHEETAPVRTGRGRQAAGAEGLAGKTAQGRPNPDPIRPAAAGDPAEAEGDEVERARAKAKAVARAEAEAAARAPAATDWPMYYYTSIMRRLSCQDLTELARLGPDP
jgi:hypothetical protein